MSDRRMKSDSDIPLGKKVKHVLIGQGRDLEDKSIFHKLSLVAFFAWVGLGADGLSSSCYGPEEAFRIVQSHPHLAIFVGLASAITIFIISASYNQIIKLFPSGGGGYLVASRLLSPQMGMISGVALLIDYILTITISVASGVDAFFSFLPVQWHGFKLEVAVVGVIGLTLLNLRGVKESVTALLPIFLAFVLTHGFVILYALFSHAGDFPAVAAQTSSELHSSVAQLGVAGTFFLLLRAYTMGAGTYTGIEAVSNGIPILREPRVKTARHTMRYMAISLSVTVLGLMIAYAFYRVVPSSAKTLNAVLLENMTGSWGTGGYVFMLITLVSEAALLFIAAQAGFLDGPRVLANMALDRWFPAKFSSLSDRLVTQNGVLLMGIAAVIMMVFSKGQVQFLVVLYSINVFITFTLSQLGMVRHWWQERAHEKGWMGKLIINGIGLSLTTIILISVTIIKFGEGGWITLILTAVTALPLIVIRRHYQETSQLVRDLNEQVMSAVTSGKYTIPTPVSGTATLQPQGKTAVLMVNGYSGLGLHTLFGIMRTFSGVFSNFVFVQIGLVDAGNFRGAEEIEHLKEHSRNEVEKYVEFMRKNGLPAAGYFRIGTDIVEEIDNLAPEIISAFPHAVFFGGQLVFPKESLFTRWLHNYTVFAVQRRLYARSIPVVVLPVSI